MTWHVGLNWHPAYRSPSTIYFSRVSNTRLTSGLHSDTVQDCNRGILYDNDRGGNPTVYIGLGQCGAKTTRESEREMQDEIEAGVKAGLKEMAEKDVPKITIVTWEEATGCVCCRRR